MNVKQESSILKTMLEEERRSPLGQEQAASDVGCLIGRCVEAEHPTLPSRCRVEWTALDGSIGRAWVPYTCGLTVRDGDTVLMLAPANHNEPVVTGVLDRLDPRRQPPPSEAGPQIRLESDETVRIAGPDGTPILELQGSETGAEVRLLVPPSSIDVPGALRLGADEIELEARKGEVRISASSDVRVEGEIVRLN